MNFKHDIYTVEVPDSLSLWFERNNMNLNLCLCIHFLHRRNTPLMWRGTRNLLQQQSKGSHPLKVLWTHPPNKTSCGRIEECPRQVWINYSSNSLSPPHTVQQQGFIDLVQHLQPFHELQESPQSLWAD